MATTTRKELTVEEEMKQKLLDILRKLKMKREAVIMEHNDMTKRGMRDVLAVTTADTIRDQIDAIVMTGKMLGILSKYVSPMRWY